MSGTKTITRFGDEAAVVLDAALLQLASLRVGDQLAVSVNEQGAIVLTPLRPIGGGEKPPPDAAAGPKAPDEAWRRAS